MCVLSTTGYFAYWVHQRRMGRGKVILSGMLTRNGTDLSDENELEIELDPRFAAPVVPVASGKAAGSFSALAVRVSGPAGSASHQGSLLF